MGMYTEIFFKAELVKDVPEEVVAILQHLVEGDLSEAYAGELPDHPLFQCQRWDMLGRGGSAYFSENSLPVLKKDWFTKQWNVVLNANLKNYGSEIEKFFDWIDPYVDLPEGRFMGYELYEESDEPSIYVKVTPRKW